MLNAVNGEKIRDDTLWTWDKLDADSKQNLPSWMLNDNVHVTWEHFESMLAVLDKEFQTYRRWYDYKGGYLIFGCWLKGSVKMKNRLVAGKNAPNIEFWLLPVQFVKYSVDQVDVAVGGFQLWLLPVQFTKPSVDQVDVDVGGFRLSNL